MSKPEMSYPERAGKMAKSARKSACAAAGRHWQSAQAAGQKLGEMEIAAFNSLRAAGEAIIQASGRGQMIFNLDVKEFVRRELLPLLPPDMSLPQVQACVHIASTVNKPIKTRDELRALKPEMQLAFQALGLTSPPRRTELQSPVARNLFCEFVSKALGLISIYDEMEKQEPMEKWPAEKLDDFIGSFAPVMEKIKCAERLLLGLKS